LNESPHYGFSEDFELNDSIQEVDSKIDSEPNMDNLEGLAFGSQNESQKQSKKRRVYARGKKISLERNIEQ